MNKKIILSVIISLVIGLAAGMGIMHGLDNNNTGTVTDETFTFTIGKEITSTEILKSKTVEFTYNNKKYLAYNDMISRFSGLTYKQAKKFIEALNKAKVDGCSNWQMLENKAMATAWHSVSSNITSFDTEQGKVRSANPGTYIWLSEKENMQYNLATKKIAYDMSDTSIIALFDGDSIVLVRPVE